MKILLIQPPIQDFYETQLRLQPIGLAYLKASLKKYHPEVEVIIRDYHTGYGRQTLRWPKELEYLHEYYPMADRSPFSTFCNYYHFGASFNLIADDIARIQPDLVGISCLFTPYFREALEVSKRVKSFRNIPVLMGGSHVSAVPESVLPQDSVDFVICGEGEKSIVDFVSFLQGKLAITEVGGLGYKINGELQFNPIKENFEIGDLPYPDLGSFSLETYKYGERALAFMITSRSCPHRCSFCSVHLTFGHRYRRRSPDDVLREIELRYEQGYRVIDFEDDNLTFYKDEMKRLCGALIARFPNREMQFVAMNGISYLSLDDELLELMWKAGFTHLNLALVSSDKLVRETTKRPHTLESYIRVVNKAHSLGFQIVSYQILGLPNEDLDSMMQTLAFNVRLPVLLGASIFYLTPQSPMALKLGNSLSEVDHFKARTTAIAYETQSFSRQDIYTLFIVNRIFNYLKGLKLERDQVLSDLLVDRQDDVGLALFSDCLKSGVLYFINRLGRFPNLKFKTEFLIKIMEQAQFVTTQDGHKIELDELGQIDQKMGSARNGTAPKTRQNHPR